MTELDKTRESLERLEETESKSGVSRRLFLTAGAGVLAALAIPNQAKANPNSIALIPTTSTTLSPITALNLPSDQDFYQPKVKGSQDGTVTAKLAVQWGTLQGYQGQTRTYAEVNGDTTTPLLPGPILCLNPGDIIEINLKNNLDKDVNGTPIEDTSCSNQINKPRCFNTTNLHFHGLHVSPLSKMKDGTTGNGTDLSKVEFSSDDVLVEIKPGESNNYKVQVPQDHAPGTHWYHPHYHGSTGLQVSNGVAGAIIIKEPSNQAICPDASDVVWILQDLLTEANSGNNQTLIKDETIYNQSGLSNPGRTLVNGKFQPKLTIKKGEIQRWRFINAGSTPRTMMNLKLCKGSLTDVSQFATANLQTMYLIARDGINFYGKKPNTQTTHAFSSGNRADFLVNLEPGDYTLVKDTYTGAADVYGNAIPAPAVAATATTSVSGGGGGGGRGTGGGGGAGRAAGVGQQPVLSNASAKSRQVLAYITVIDDTKEPYPKEKADAVKNQFDTLLTQGIPETGKPAYLAKIEGDFSRMTPKKVVFKATSNREFTINNFVYHDSNAPDHTKFTVNLNTEEEWMLDNISNATDPNDITKGIVTHPFHIHVNPFQVVAIGAKSGGTTTWTEVPQADRIWLDTVGVDPNIPLKIQHRFDDYNGKFVLHCHILIHEDQGMMYDVEVQNDTQLSGKPPGPIPA